VHDKSAAIGLAADATAGRKDKVEPKCEALAEAHAEGASGTDAEHQVVRICRRRPTRHDPLLITFSNCHRVCSVHWLSLVL